MRRLVFIAGLAPLIAIAFTSSYWLSQAELPFLLNTKPFVYRVLLIWLAELVSLFGMSFEYSLRIWVALSMLGATIAMYRLVSLWSIRSSLWIWLMSVGVMEIFLFLFFWRSKPYDFATLLFFCLMLYYLEKKEWVWFILVFALSCFNRETTLIMLMVFFVYALRIGLGTFRLWCLASLQAGLWVVIQYYLHQLFQGAQYPSIWWRPVENLIIYRNFFWLALLQWTFLFGIGVCCFRWYKASPILLQQAILIMAPVWVAGFILVGWSFEIRFFIELYAVIAPIAILSVERLPIKRQLYDLPQI